MRRAALLAISLSATSLLNAPAHAACANSGQYPAFEQATLHVHITASQPSYRRGERVVLTVAVTQVDDFGPKVRGASTRVRLTKGTKVLRDLGGETDADGLLVLRTTVTSKDPLGPLKAEGTSRAEHLVDPDCHPQLTSTGHVVVDPIAALKA